MSPLAPNLQFGPELPQFGSWNWLGHDLVEALNGPFVTGTFDSRPSDADVLVVLKFLPPAEVLRSWKNQARIVFCPVDVYGQASDIDRDAERLQLCDRIVVHSERLSRYFRGYSRVVSLPHHVKYISDILPQRPADGPLLWVGVRGNLPPVVNWLNGHDLVRPVVIMTDAENDQATPTAAELGIRHSDKVQVERWTVENHLQWLPRCRAAFDVKGDDFRSRHKPPAKVCDYLASGIPVAVSAGSSAAEHLQELGFDIAELHEPRWLSDDYLADTIRFGRALKELYSLRRIAGRWERMLLELLQNDN